MSQALPPSVAWSRRRFLAFSSLVPVALAMPAGVGVLSAAEAKAPSASARRSRVIGLELYSVREALAKDLPGTLRKVAAMGYEAVEFYSPYLNWTPSYAKEVRALLDELGLRCLSTHNSRAAFADSAALGKAMELNQILGAHQLVLASAGKEMNAADDWKQLAEILSRAVTQLSPQGMTAGFHNHQTEWRALPTGERAMDILAENTPKEFVLQLDVGTCMEAGVDPVAWINSHPGRIRSAHLKDWAPGRAEDEKAYRVLFTEGVSPWKEIIAALESVGGVEVFLLEQEGSRFDEFETARRCLANWQTLTASL